MFLKHGLSRTIYYDRWRHMMDRCYNEECDAYPNYGGRGIRVCEAWHNIENYAADLPKDYFEGAHLDRIDNDGHYEPNNVRWVTPKKNHDNRRSGVMLTHDGRTQSMTAWSNETGVHIATIWNRLNVEGWSVEKTLTTPAIEPNERMAIARQARWGNHTKKPSPPKREFRTVDLHGATLTLAQLALISGVPHKLLAKRIFERGWSVERAITKEK